MDLPQRRLMPFLVLICVTLVTLMTQVDGMPSLTPSPAPPNIKSKEPSFFPPPNESITLPLDKSEIKPQKPTPFTSIKKDIVSIILTYLSFDTVLKTWEVNTVWKDAGMSHLEFILEQLPDNIWKVIEFCTGGQTVHHDEVSTRSSPCLAKKIDLNIPASFLSNSKLISHYLEPILFYEEYLHDQNHKLAPLFKNAITHTLDTKLGPCDQDIIICKHYGTLLYNRAGRFVKLGMTEFYDWPLPTFIITYHDQDNQPSEIVWSTFVCHDWSVLTLCNGNRFRVVQLECSYSDFRGFFELKYDITARTYSASSVSVRSTAWEEIATLDVVSFRIVLSVLNY